MTTIPRALPTMSEHGHFYLGARGRAPAIFLVQNPRSPDLSRYFPCPEEGDVPFAEGRILAFDTPEEALAWLQRRARR